MASPRSRSSTARAPSCAWVEDGGHRRRPHRALALDLALGLAASLGPHRGDLLTGVGRQEHAGHSVFSEAQRNGGICATSTPSTPWTRFTRRPLASTSTSCDLAARHREQALEICDLLVRSSALDVIIIDSVSALTPAPRSRADGRHPLGLQPASCPRPSASSPQPSRSQTIAVFINQLREKIGVMFGSPETTPVVALEFLFVVRLDIRRIEAIQDASNLSQPHGVKVARTSALPVPQAEFDIMRQGHHPRGLGSMSRRLRDREEVRRWYTYEGEQLGRERRTPAVPIETRAHGPTTTDLPGRRHQRRADDVQLGDRPLGAEPRTTNRS